MEPGSLVRFEDYSGDVYFGVVLYIDTDSTQETLYHIFWNDGSKTLEPDCQYQDGIIEVIQ